MKKFTSKYLLFGLWSVAFCIRKCLNLGFSSVIITPLLGCFLPIGHACGVLAGMWCLKAACNCLPITMGLATMFSTLSWSLSTRNNNSFTIKLCDYLLHIGLPLTCMALFMSHDIGYQAWTYTLYWCIPMILFIARTTGFLRYSLCNALQSTFIAHAVGSVVWLFKIPTTTAYWHVLIPIVALERLMMALSMAMLYELGSYTIMLFKNKRAPFLHDALTFKH